MTPVVIALGSNVGDALGNVRVAVARLRDELVVERVSSPYRTAPMYVEDQEFFVNAALTGKTTWGPRGLLRLLKTLEQELGRERRQRFGPREIDLDLIAFGDLALDSNADDKPLRLPHPRVVERRFVLAPLAEIAPQLRLVGLGTAKELLDRTNDAAHPVEKIDADL